MLLRRGEFHQFDADGATHVYLVPSAAVFRLDGPSAAVLDALGEGDLARDALLDRLAARFEPTLLGETIDELVAAQAVRPVAAPKPAPAAEGPRRRIPLTTLVMNVTSKCNLSCKYCYEYGEDRIVEPTTKPRFMSEETARESVDFMLSESGAQSHVHLTFFGGETLLNFKVLKFALGYAKERAAALGKSVDASLTTNATLLREEIIDWMVENDVGVTVSMDGAREQQDALRVFANGAGSYDVVIPRVKELLRRHNRRPIGARVTLTKGNLDVVNIYRHLKEEIGFWEVGFAPVTTSWQRDYAIQAEGFEEMLGQFQVLAAEYRETSLQGRHHGFSNVRDTLDEIHKGVAKAYPCGAGLGLLGVATDGDVGLCHRFAGSDRHKLGTVRDGVDHALQDDYLRRHHIDNKTDCHTCWARSLCAGGCYHEAQTRYGSTEAPNLHYCEWIRRWSATCLEVYATLAARRPEFLRQFDA
ncbi:MAG: quinohemoprotein amine dehydrogenase maturation protein [Gemmatimonadaceae bacterium]|nr:quinohemoprotein amine dehydrogenase maturation protein [Gemmatimonadaceae bacterium]